MRTAAEIEAAREEGRRWYKSVVDELVPVTDVYRDLPTQLTVRTPLTVEAAHGSIEDYGVGPLFVIPAPGHAEEREDGSYHYVYAFVASPTINDAVQAQTCWTVGIDYSDGDVVTRDFPVGTDPERIARTLLGMAHIMLATYDMHYETPRARA